MLQKTPDAEEQKVQYCCSSANSATRVLSATDLHLLIGTLLLGQPKRQVSGVTSPITSFSSSAQAYFCKRALSASTGLLSNRVLPGGLREGCISLPRSEKKQNTGKIKLFPEEERLLFFLTSPVGPAWVLLPAGPGWDLGCRTERLRRTGWKSAQGVVQRDYSL